MIKREWEDEYGSYIEQVDGAILHNPSQKWYDENPMQTEQPPQPTEIDILREQVARGNAELLEAISLMLGGV